MNKTIFHFIVEQYINRCVTSIDTILFVYASLSAKLICSTV